MLIISLLKCIGFNNFKICKWGPINFNGEMINKTSAFDSNMRGSKSIIFVKVYYVEFNGVSFLIIKS